MLLRTAVADDLPVLRDVFRRASRPDCGGAAADVEAHLLACEECGRRFDQIDLADDPMVQAIRGHAPRFVAAPVADASSVAPPELA